MQTVELHKSHVIECVHEAEPTATVSWYHNNEPIEIDGHHHQALGSELVFLETKEHDEGIYRCKASNKFGSATSPEFSLSVIKPSKCKYYLFFLSFSSTGQQCLLEHLDLYLFAPSRISSMFVSIQDRLTHNQRNRHLYSRPTSSDWYLLVPLFLVPTNCSVHVCDVDHVHHGGQTCYRQT